MIKLHISAVSALIAAIGSVIVMGISTSSIAETADERLLRGLAGAATTNTHHVRTLLAKGARPDVPDNAGRAALHGAAAIGAAETARVLLGAGADPNRQDRDGNTPLHLAVDDPALATSAGGALATVRLLLNAGADANRANADGGRPLHMAGSHGSPDVIVALLKGGADPKLGNGTGLTALQIFVRIGPDEGDTAAMLIDAGANPDRKYPNGDAPLHATIREGGSRGKLEVAEALLEGGADPCIRDARGYIPQQIAEEGGVIHRALDRAGGYEPACDKKGERVAAGEARTMRARTRVNVRAGPGTRHEKVGLLEAGQEVRVTGEEGEWLRIEGSRGGEAFVHGSLLVMPEVRGSSRAPALSPKCDGMPEGSQCWREISNKPDCFIWDDYSRTNQSIIWSGVCSNSATAGPGTLRYEWNGLFVEGKGTLNENSEPVGRWSWRRSDGSKSEGSYVNVRKHGQWVTRYSNGDCSAKEYSHGTVISQSTNC